MKKETFEKKVKKFLCTKQGAVKKCYSHLYGFIESDSRFHGCKWSCGKGRFNLSASAHVNLIKALDAIGVDYSVGNDAPRGGWEGMFVELTEKGRRQVAEMRKYLQSQTKEKKEQERQQREEKEQRYKKQCEATYKQLKEMNVALSEEEKYMLLSPLTNRKQRKQWFHAFASNNKVWNNEGLKKYIEEQINKE